METILKDLREACKKLGEEAIKKIEKKYVGKGAVILTSTSKYNRMVEKTYTVCKPYKIIYPGILSFGICSDKRIDIIISTYPNTNRVAISYQHINNNKKDNFFSRISYKDTIEFTSKTTADAILKEIRSLIKDDGLVNLISKTENEDYQFMLVDYPAPILPLENNVIVPISQLTNIIKEDLENYLYE